MKKKNGKNGKNGKREIAKRASLNRPNLPPPPQMK